MTKLINLFKELEEAERKSDEIDALAWEDPENEELEAAWTKAYEEEWGAAENLINEITKITSGAIDYKTARALITAKRAELKELLGIA